MCVTNSFDRYRVIEGKTTHKEDIKTYFQDLYKKWKDYKGVKAASLTENESSNETSDEEKNSDVTENESSAETSDEEGDGVKEIKKKKVGFRDRRVIMIQFYI